MNYKLLMAIIDIKIVVLEARINLAMPYTYNADMQREARLCEVEVKALEEERGRLKDLLAKENDEAKWIRKEMYPYDL